MKITAPERWLDDVDLAALRQWFLDRGFTDHGRWLTIPGKYPEILLPSNLKDFPDWRSRLLEAIEDAAKLDGITAAEWFERERGRQRVQEPLKCRECQSHDVVAVDVPGGGICRECFDKIQLPEGLPGKLFGLPVVIDSDRCPETGEPDCQRCSGEFCERHGAQPCDCDVAERHHRDVKHA